MLRIPHCLDNRLRDGVKVVSPTHTPHLLPRNIIIIIIIKIIIIIMFLGLIYINLFSWTNIRSSEVVCFSEISLH
jgi:hypothetical protein